MFKRPFIMALHPPDASAEKQYCIARQRFFIWSYLDHTTSDYRNPYWRGGIDPGKDSAHSMETIVQAQRALTDIHRDRESAFKAWLRRVFVGAGRQIDDIDKAQDILEGKS